MIPVKYNVGNLSARRASTAMTILGIGVVVAVMLSMMALYNGVLKATISSGSKENMIVMREGAEAELSSWIRKDAFQIIRVLPGVQAISPETVILFKLPKKDDPKGSNVLVRGVTPAAFTLRPQVKLVEGRMFRPGSNELIAARRIKNRFANCAVGDTFQFGPQTWTVVGIFDANGTAFDSEIWADLEYLGQARKRGDSYSSVLIRPNDRAAFESIKATIKGDNRLKLQAMTEHQYYANQTKALSGIMFLVGLVTFFMVIGAGLGTMNAMFSAVASRTRELATLRALGYKRRSVIFSMIWESGLVALLGGIAGVLLSLPVNLISTGTTNWQTFSEVAFDFQVSPAIVGIGLLLTLLSGIFGGLIPAVISVWKPITTSLREI